MCLPLRKYENSASSERLLELLHEAVISLNDESHVPLDTESTFSPGYTPQHSCYSIYSPNTSQWQLITTRHAHFGMPLSQHQGDKRRLATLDPRTCVEISIQVIRTPTQAEPRLQGRAHRFHVTFPTVIMQSPDILFSNLRASAIEMLCEKRPRDYSILSTYSSSNS